MATGASLAVPTYELPLGKVFEQLGVLIMIYTDSSQEETAQRVGKSEGVSLAGGKLELRAVAAGTDLKTRRDGSVYLLPQRNESTALTLDVVT